jgi:hypothetical protein
VSYHQQNTQLGNWRGAGSRTSSGLGNILDTIMGLFNQASAGAAVQAADLACSNEYQAMAAAGVAQRTGIARAGQKFREATREAQRYCTAAGYRAAESEAQEKAVVTGAWVVAGIAALGIGVALWATTRKNNRKRRNGRAPAAEARAFARLGGAQKLTLKRHGSGYRVLLDGRIAGNVRRFSTARQVGRWVATSFGHSAYADTPREAAENLLRAAGLAFR